MVAKRKKKYESGEAAQYMSRKAALKYLQLSLRDFRRLCILKGIYPREPRKRKRAQKGSTSIQTLYFKKDIQFLLHEPLIWKFRDLKVHGKKMGRAFGLKDYETMKLQMSKHPTFNLDHLVKERYPTFIDALRDLDDCLTLCSVFSTFPSMKHVPRDQSALCRRLTIEFMHAVIEAKALRKVFVSIKGFYYQIEYKGQTITWITPHQFCFQPQSKEDVDFKVMSIFVQFYVVLLGFVNYHMYHSLNLVYPPQLPGYETGKSEDSLTDSAAFTSERVAALNVPICKAGTDVTEENEIDDFPSGDQAEIEEHKQEIMKLQKLKTLFKDKKFFLNKEVPREPLVFVIRCFGGFVSWDKACFEGATFDESDETIAYQIVDRPSMDKQYLSRYYLQPQWIFDSVNACELLPVEKYLMGAILPPHLSPFVNEGKDQIYIPPEEKMLKDPNYKPEKQEDDSDNDEEEENEDESSSEPEANNDDDDREEAETTEQDNSSENKLKGMSVTPGEVFRESPVYKQIEKRHEYKLREKMVPNKYRKLYKSMMEGRQKRAKEIWLLEKKRRRIDEMEKQEKKNKKKQHM
ncbi:hypothetical protein RUM44_008471 [Polyplax serrata]|uniref:Pescadillo homolog n=1 Tax=Polyplax serrata TaxID=468196 RepID=A0ABR1B8C9_POLSC